MRGKFDGRKHKQGITPEFLEHTLKTRNEDKWLKELRDAARNVENWFSVVVDVSPSSRMGGFEITIITTMDAPESVASVASTEIFHQLET